MGLDKEHFLRHLSESLRGFNAPPPSRWERNRVYLSCQRRLGRLVFERGTSTSRRAILLEHFEPDFTFYEPSPWLAIRWTLRHLRPGPSDVLVDFGCGKGRVICEAARRPFGRVVGVEISPALIEVARLNVDRTRHRFKCQNVELFTANAAAWVIPDDMTMGYLYHPFAGATLERVLENVVESIERNPRRVRLAYVAALPEQEILDTGYFRVIDRRRGRGRSGRWAHGVSLLEHDPVRSRTSTSPGDATASHKTENAPPSGDDRRA